MANTIQLAVGDGQFKLHVPEMKSIDNLVSVEANLDNEGEINLVDRPVISIRPVSYENENLTCEYHIHYQQNNNQNQVVNLRLSVFYRDMVIDTKDTNQEIETIKKDINDLHDDVYNNFLKKTASEKQVVEPQVDFKLTPTINGVPIGGASVDLSSYVRKDEVLKTLCEECGWVGDLQNQITINGKDIDTLQKRLEGDILYEQTREIVLDKSTITQTLMGSFYYYTYNYDISQWDNSVYNLTSITLKNIFIEDVNGRQASVNEVIQKALNSITFDDNKLYGVILTPNIFNYSTGKVKAVLSCQYKKMINDAKEKEGK